jgi:hypothetical protein
LTSVRGNVLRPSLVQRSVLGNHKGDNKCIEIIKLPSKREVHEQSQQ